jgi:hypothetical protein
MLKTEHNTPTMEARVRRAWRRWRFQQCGSRRAAGFSFDFEHGQWWVTDLDTGAQWSVVDAEGGSSVDGFDFEQISYGEDE